MKKPLTFLIILFISFRLVGQNNPYLQQANSARAPFNSGAMPSNHSMDNASRSSGPFDMWIDPIYNIMVQKSVDYYSGFFLAPVFMDSTVITGSNSAVYDNMIGSVLDPQSTLLQSSYEPILHSYDTYSIDSVAIWGSYVKTSASIDTLYTWLVWGNPSDNSIFYKESADQAWVYPISTMRDTIIGPKISGATSNPGNQVFPSANSSNSILIKYVLQQSDSSASTYYKRIAIGLPSPITIPGNNIVSCFYTFVPGSSYSAGDCIYNFPGDPTPQNQNGFAGIVWGQTYPQVSSVYDYLDYQVDATSWCMGLEYTKYQRHNLIDAGFMYGALVQAPVIEYSIYGTSTDPIGAPTALSATNRTCTSFDANWDSIPGATEYFLDVSTDNSFSSFITGFNNFSVGDSLNYTISGLDTAVDYFYRVRATNNITTSTNSSVIHVTSQYSTPPHLIPSNIGCTSFTLNWNDQHADAYYIDVATDASFTSFVGSYNNYNAGTSTSSTITGLSTNSIYYCRIRQMSVCGLSSSSAALLVFTCDPSGITNLSNPDLVTIYPNPASDKLILHSDKTNNSTIELINSVGKLVKKVNSSQETTEIDITELPNGIYVIKYSAVPVQLTRKITISK